MAAKKKSGTRKAMAKRSAKRPAKKAAKKGAARKPAKKAAKRGTARRGAARKPAKKTARKAAKKPAKKAAKKARKPAKKRGIGGGLAMTVQPNEKLAAVVGSSPMTRAEITKRLWAYIKKNNLQDKTNRRQINADDKLRPVFAGKGQVSMFEMTKLVNQNVR